MKTRDRIKAKALELFNGQGVRNVTLRHIAAALGKSYGNVTYHFANKAVLVEALYAAMVEELTAMRLEMQQPDCDLFRQILEAPAANFRISCRYIFLFKDYVELMRNYGAVAEAVRKSNAQRAGAFMRILKVLVDQGLLRKDLTDEDLAYLMELSAAMRTQFMMLLEPDADFKAAERAFLSKTNRLLKPYLTDVGRAKYGEWEKENAD